MAADICRLSALIQLLEVEGLELRMPHSRAMSEGLFELRCKGAEGWSAFKDGWHGL